jgi:hypothetical protein
MASPEMTQTPQTPQTPAPPPPSGIPGTTTVTVTRTVTTGSADPTATPQPPTPPQPPPGATSDLSSAPSETTFSVADGQSLAAALKPQTVFRVQLGISTVQIDGETIIHDQLRNTNTRLNASGSFIWSQILLGLSFSDLMAKIQEAHTTVPPDLEKVVSGFLADLIQRGVITAT